MIKNLFAIAGILAVLMMQSCYALNSANTTVEVAVSKDGNCAAKYSSNKEQVGLEASVCGGNVKVDKSGSSEAIAAGSLANQLELIRLLGTLVQQSQKAAPVPVK